MQTARQHALLNALGIRQWVPRATATVVNQTTNKTLWRNDSNSNNNDAPNEIASPQINHGAPTESINIPVNGAFNTQSNLNINPSIQPEIVQQIEPNSLIRNNVELSLPVAKIQTAFKPVNVERNDLVKMQSDSWADEFELSQQSALSFQLQAIEINQWIILVNESDLQQVAAAKLWQNILLGFKQPAISHFAWPLAEGQRWQRRVGAKAALSGFLFKLGLDKRIGLMSALPDEVCVDRIERLPHLQELLDEPLKKRLLWNLLK